MVEEPGIVVSVTVSSVMLDTMTEGCKPIREGGVGGGGSRGRIMNPQIILSHASLGGALDIFCCTIVCRPDLAN